MCNIGYIARMAEGVFPDEIDSLCKELGSRLHAFRVNELNETQEIMARRIGVSRRTYVRMEAGDPTVKIGYWLEAAMVTRTMDGWKSLFTVKKTLFDELGDASAEINQKQRRRASARKGSKR